MKVRHSGIIFTARILAIVLLTITPVHAYQIELPPQGGLNIKLLSTVTEGYSNNITYSRDDEDKIEDFLTTINLGLNIQYEGKRRQLGLNGGANWQIPSKALDVKNSSERMSFNFQDELTGYDTLSLSDTYTHSQVPENFDEEFGRSGGRFDSYSNRISATYTRGITGDLNASAGYTYGKSWFSREGSSDSISNDVNSDLRYTYSAATNCTLHYGFADIRFDDGVDIVNHLLRVSVVQHITKRLYLDVSAGVNISSREDDKDTREDLGLTINASIDDKTESNLTYTRGISVSEDEGDIFDNWRATLQISRQWLEDMSSSISGFYGEGKFDATGVKDKLTGATGLISYRFWENEKGANINGRLGYTYSRLVSSGENRGYNRGALDIGFTVGF